MQELLSARQIQLVGLNMLKYLDALCREHGIRCFLSGGTLLGAIRHQGFIPWDDDVDVMMPRPDYNRLLELVKSIRHERFAFLTETKEDYATPYLRLMDTHTDVLPTEYLSHPVPHLFLDIFPIEGLPDDENKCRAFYQKMRAYDIMYQSARKSKFRKGERLQLLKKCVHAFAMMTGGTAAWCKRFDQAAQQVGYGTTKHAGVCLIAHYGMRERMPIDVFEGSVPVTFEGCEFSAPAGYHRYLTGLYRDYMQLPPPEKRVSLHRLQCRYIPGHPADEI